MSNERDVVLLAPFPPPFGGMSVHAVRLAAGLEKAGWRVHRVAAGRLRPTVSVAPVFVGNSIMRHVLAMVRSKDGILHVHDRLSILTFVACAVAKLRRMKVVISEHGVPRNLLRRSDGVDVFLAAALRMADRVIAVNTHVERLLRPFVRCEIQTCPAYLPPSEDEIRSTDSAIEGWLGGGDTPIVSLLAYRLLPQLFNRQDIYGLSVARKAVVEATERGAVFRFAVLLSCPPEGDEEHSFWSREIGMLRATLGSRLGVFVGAFAPPLLARTEVLLRPTLTDGDAVSIREGLDLGCQVIASNAAPRPAGVVVHDSTDPNELARQLLAALARAPGRLRQMERGSTTLQQHIEIYKSLLE